MANAVKMTLKSGNQFCQYFDTEEKAQRFYENMAEVKYAYLLLNGKIVAEKGLR